MTFIFSLTLLTGTLFAQQATPRPQPGSIRVPSQDEPPAPPDDAALEKQEREESAKTNGFVRVWNFTGTDQNLGVFLAEPDTKVPPTSERLWLTRGSVSGDTRSYTALPDGKYEVMVMADGSTAGNLKALKDEFDPKIDLLLSQPLRLNVSKGSYQTIRIFPGKNGKLSAEVLNDGAVDKGTLRVFNFAEDYKSSVFVMSGVKKTVLIPDVPAEPMSVKLPAQSKLVVLEVSYKHPQTGRSYGQILECDFSTARSYTAVISCDRYGNYTVRGHDDAPK